MLTIIMEVVLVLGNYQSILSKTNSCSNVKFAVGNLMKNHIVNM
jgi:hypothetical protein